MKDLNAAFLTIGDRVTLDPDEHMNRYAGPIIKARQGLVTGLSISNAHRPRAMVKWDGLKRSQLWDQYRLKKVEVKDERQESEATPSSGGD